MRDPRLGTHLGKYEILGALGRGGMGVVYEARDPLLDRRVALKLLPATVADDPTALKRFLAEAKAAARLDHPNTVGIYEVDCRGGEYFIAMQLVRGVSASERLKSAGPFEWTEATRIVALTAQGLAAAHAAGIIHRDIKPSNILLSHDGAVKISDFGLAKARWNGDSLSLPNSVAGTPHYMSPEQCRGQRLDGRSDLYSLGATYFALLVGRPPFQGQRPTDILHAHCHLAPPDICTLKADIPPEVSAVVARALAKQPQDRYTSAEDMAGDLEALLVAAVSGDPGLAAGLAQAMGLTSASAQMLAFAETASQSPENLSDTAALTATPASDGQRLPMGRAGMGLTRSGRHRIVVVPSDSRSPLRGLPGSVSVSGSMSRVPGDWWAQHFGAVPPGIVIFSAVGLLGLLIVILALAWS